MHSKPESDMNRHRWADWNGDTAGTMSLEEAVAWFWDNWGPCKLFGDDTGWWMEDEYTGAVVGQTF